MTRLLAVLTILYGQVVFAQADDAGIRLTVNNLFEGMKKADTALIRSAFTAEPIFQTVLQSKDGKTRVETEILDSFLISIAQPHSQVYDERIVFETVKSDGQLAIVWAPYKFYLGDKFSHCGTDSFQLVKLNGIWKILYLVDTRRREGCN